MAKAITAKQINELCEEKTKAVLRICDEFDIPGYMRAGVVGYVINGRGVGDFLTSVFDNDLMRAGSHADETNIACLAGYAGLLWNTVPTAAIGRDNRVEWQEKRGLRGMYEATRAEQLEQGMEDGSDEA